MTPSLMCFRSKSLCIQNELTSYKSNSDILCVMFTGETMKMMGFTFTFILCGSVMSLSLFCGLLFATKEKVTDTEVEGDKPKEVKRSRASSVTTAVTLKFKGGLGQTTLPYNHSARTQKMKLYTFLPAVTVQRP